MSKYTDALYPDKINDLIDNDGNINPEVVPAGGTKLYKHTIVLSLPSIGDVTTVILSLRSAPFVQSDLKKIHPNAVGDLQIIPIYNSDSSGNGYCLPAFVVDGSGPGHNYVSLGVVLFSDNSLTSLRMSTLISDTVTEL